MEYTENAIDYASENSHLDVVEYLLEVQHAECSENAIYFACYNGHLDVVKYWFHIEFPNCIGEQNADASDAFASDVLLY